MTTNQNSVILTAICVAACICLTACNQQNNVTPPPISKKIVGKASPVEQRMGFDPFDNHPLRQKSETVFYLVAEDGTVAEVGLSTYTTTQIGSNYATHYWMRK